MVEHLTRRAEDAVVKACPEAGDLILDIGSNDSTLLQAYPKYGFELVGIDPTGELFAELYPRHIQLIPDYFSDDVFEGRFGRKQAKIVTSIAMFYDLEDPQRFMHQIHRILAPDGIWIFEQSYLPSMLSMNAYDTICHEHISYYALKQIKFMTDRGGFKIIDVELNDVNGGSFCVTVAKDSSSYSSKEAIVERLLLSEDEQGLHSLEAFNRFRNNVENHRERLREFIIHQKALNRGICGYGASTKGNVILQYCGLSTEHITAIAEVNDKKFGAYTPKTHIPILSEEEIRAQRPDYLLVLPWHFRQGIIERERDYLKNGGKLLFPLPEIQVVSMRQNGELLVEGF